MSQGFARLIEMVRSGASVLSLQEGPLQVDAEDRGLMCLVAVPGREKRAVMAISTSHRLDPHVLHYQENVRRLGWECEYVPCDMRSVLDLYRFSPARSGELAASDSDLQRYIVGLIDEATELRSSDLHIVVRSGYCEILCRSDGVLQPMQQLRGDEGVRLCATIYQSMCDVAEPTFKPLQAQRARMKDEFLAECGLSGARINTRPLARGMLMVLRLLYAESPGAVKTLSELGYLPEQCEILEELMEQRTGMVLLSGPTGSGKSTTLKVIMQKLMAEQAGIHLLTLEDPPEYEIEGANQSPVTGDRGDAGGVAQEWANAISDAMRLDPDVIMIGEVRDSVTAKMAFRAAMTGHLIWTTIHANDGLAILPRLQDESVMETLLTDSKLVTGLVNQSLVQVLCQHCKMPLIGNENEVSSRLLERLRAHCRLESVFLQGPGCEHCRYRGVAGRTVVAEVIKTSPGLMQAYADGHHLGALKYWLHDMCGLSKVDALIRKINEGFVDPRAGERVIGPVVPALLTLGT